MFIYWFALAIAGLIVSDLASWINLIDTPAKETARSFRAKVKFGIFFSLFKIFDAVATFATYCYLFRLSLSLEVARQRLVAFVHFICCAEAGGLSALRYGWDPHG